MKQSRKTRAERRPRRTRRGVSPIIATILLVAITVVLAAVLYILVSSFGNNPKPTVAVTLIEGQVGVCDGANDYGLSVGGTTSTLTTAEFGIQLQPAGAVAPTAPGTAGAKSTTACGVAPPASGWIALLLSPGGVTSLAYFDSAGWHDWNATTLPATVAGGATIEIVAVPALGLSDATVSVYGVANGPGVTGQANL